MNTKKILDDTLRNRVCKLYEFISLPGQSLKISNFISKRNRESGDKVNGNRVRHESANTIEHREGRPAGHSLS